MNWEGGCKGEPTGKGSEPVFKKKKKKEIKASVSMIKGKDGRSDSRAFSGQSGQKSP